MYDFHIHSNFSLDSKATMESVVKTALEKNLKTICFTDHVDFEATEDKSIFFSDLLTILGILIGSNTSIGTGLRFLQGLKLECSLDLKPVMTPLSRRMGLILS